MHITPYERFLCAAVVVTPAVRIAKCAKNVAGSLNKLDKAEDAAKAFNAADKVQDGVKTAGRGFSSFKAFKKAMDPTGDGKQWHHIVEQGGPNVERFGVEAIHNTSNVIPLDSATHHRMSGLYSSIRREITGSASLTIREWLRGQSFERQREFGLRAIENLRNGIW